MTNHAINRERGPDLAKGRADSTVLPSGRALSIALKKHGISERILADRLGVSSSECHRQLVGDHRVDIDRLASALPRVALTFLELMADAISASLPDADSTPVSVRQLTVTQLTGEVAGELRSALADGTIDEAEAARIARPALALADESRRLVVRVTLDARKAAAR